MRIEITRRYEADLSLEQFADRYGLTLQVTDYGQARRPAGRYVVRFKGVEVVSGPVVSSVYGNGDTIEAAIAEYKFQIAGKRLVLDEMMPNRKDFLAPSAFLPEGITEAPNPDWEREAAQAARDADYVRPADAFGDSEC